MKNCPFCTEREDGLLYETDNFFVRVGKAIVTAGHVMIIPKEHIPTIAAINEKLISEYLELKERLRKEISLKFAEPFIAEHGVFGHSVSHAHVHFIPSSGNGYKNVDFIKEMIEPAIKKFNIPFIKNSTFKDLQKVFKEDGQYMYFEYCGESYLLETKHYTENEIGDFVFYRQFLTKTKGVKGIKSWHHMSDEDKLLDKAKVEKTFETITL